jgi:UDP-N-acetylmuramyl pentapeptide phosphotransferase/UDP-N-acetylglucosamine-1-phosphate transferase
MVPRLLWRLSDGIDTQGRDPAAAATPMNDIANVESGYLVLAPVAVLAALISTGLIRALLPWLQSYALARPNARSSHRQPTPQGGGAAVIMATVVAAGVGAALASASLDGATGQFLALTAAATLLAVVGAIDDIRVLPATPRLILQCLAVGLVIAALPAALRVTPMLPWWIERAGLLVAGVWFVNLTNFMDGIDWMTVTETVPITGTIVLLGLLGAVPALPMLVAIALLGAIVGFAPFNKPVARLFLGDVGSLPIGLILAWLLLQVAVSGHLAAAILLPLYYLADATLTLLRRVLAKEPIWQAHRTHFYQRAADGGFTVTGIVARVAMLNLALVTLALLTAVQPGFIASTLALAIGSALVGWLLLKFARGKNT